ncbi:MAG TPA: flagellar motor switch protein FliN [Bryobacteraceae bacterium]|nr:flagellar motor switch protein FliN [Bryobacteraceae bacterium]
MPIDTQPLQNARWLAAEIGQRFAQALEALLGSEQRLEVVASGGPPAGPRLWCEQLISTADGASILVGATEELWLAIGAKILTSVEIEPSASEARKTYFETWNQAMSAVAQALVARTDSQVACGQCMEVPGPAGQDITYFELQLPGWPQSTPGALLVGLPAALLRILDGGAGERSAGLPVMARAGELEEVAQSPRTLDLLLDVELPVTISFGRAQLQLKEVLKLCSGSIVELNRTISEPVEVIVNNCVIARGEVVVIEGNYGVRINEIVSRQERLRTLK